MKRLLFQFIILMSKRLSIHYTSQKLLARKDSDIYIFELTIFYKLAVNVLIWYYLCLVSDGATTTGAPSGIPPPQVLLSLPQFPGHREAGADPPLSPLWFLPPPVDPYIPVYVDKHWIQRAIVGKEWSHDQFEPVATN